MMPKKQLQQIVGTLVGGAIGFYCGIMVFFPLIGGAIAGALAKRFASRSFQPFIPALAIICGHATWMFIGGMLLAYFAKLSWLMGLLPVSVDLVVIIAGIPWLLLRPGLGPVIFLSIYEILTLMVNGYVICNLQFGGSGHKALVLHIVLRIGALWLLFIGYRQFKKNAAEVLSPETLPQNQGSGPIHILMEDGQRLVYEEAQIHDLLARNALGSATYFWREGMQDWQPIDQLTPPK